MFYTTKIKDFVRVSPDLFDLPVDHAIIKQVKRQFEGHIDKDIGVVIDVLGVDNIGEGVIIPGDGAAYYATEFELMTYKPELQELALGKVRDIADFGAFMLIGPIEGMIHVSQTMDDFVSFSKEKVLLGKDSKKTLKVGDLCKARIIAVSFKDMSNPKIGLTMRQPGLGKIESGVDKPKEKEEEK